MRRSSETERLPPPPASPHQPLVMISRRCGDEAIMRLLRTASISVRKSRLRLWRAVGICRRMARHVERSESRRTAMTTEEPKDKFGNWRPWAHGLHRAGVRVHPIPACPFRHMLPLVRRAPAMPQGLLPCGRRWIGRRPRRMRSAACAEREANPSSALRAPSPTRGEGDEPRSAGRASAGHCCIARDVVAVSPHGEPVEPRGREHRCGNPRPSTGSG